MNVKEERSVIEYESVDKKGVNRTEK